MLCMSMTKIHSSNVVKVVGRSFLKPELNEMLGSDHSYIHYSLTFFLPAFSP